MAEKQLDLLKLAARRPAELGARPATIMRRDARDAIAYCWSICQTTFSDMASPCTLSPRFTGRNTWPSPKPAAEVQASIATFTQVGIGTVRTRLCLPTISTMHQ